MFLDWIKRIGTDIYIGPVIHRLRHPARNEANRVSHHLFNSVIGDSGLTSDDGAGILYIAGFEHLQSLFLVLGFASAQSQ